MEKNKNPNRISTMEWTRGEVIGHGSFGSVNLAIPRKFYGREFPIMAVKSCLNSHSVSLRHEKNVLNQLSNCSNIIKCYGDDCTVENGEMFYNLFLEFATKGSLFDMLKKNSGDFTLPGSEIRRYTKGILEGLLYIHSNGFVHCDIKLQNLLICNEVVKIADFGISKKANCKTEIGFRGTPLNMSPESVNFGEYEPPADIWALGCVIIELASGESGWKVKNGCDVNELLLRIGIGDEVPDIPDGFCEDGKDFVKKCFVKNPRERWTAKMLLEHPFVAAAMADFDGGGGEDLVSPKSPFEYPCLVSNPTPKLITESPVLQSAGRETLFVGELKLLPESTFDWPGNRIGELVTEVAPDWSLAENWVTVRCWEN